MKSFIIQALIGASIVTVGAQAQASPSLRGAGDGGHHGRLLEPNQRLTTGEVVKGEWCGTFGDYCTIGGKKKKTGQVRWGDPKSNRFSHWRNVPDDGIKCQNTWKSENEGFGMDPAPGVEKNCYWRAGPSEAEVEANKEIKTCAKQGSNCECLGGQARYGQYANGNKKGDRWTNWIDVTGGSARCWSSGLGGFEPAKGVEKICECRPIPAETIGFPSYTGYWERKCENCDSLEYKETFTFGESITDTVSEAFMEGLEQSVAAQVGYTPSATTGGPSASLTVTQTIKSSYERTSSLAISNSRSQSVSNSCKVTSCGDGTLYRWMIEGRDLKNNPAIVATCRFVCIPNENQQTSRLEPVCPEPACNMNEDCSCCLKSWAADDNTDEHLCSDRPTPAPVVPNEDDPTELEADNIVVTCENVQCSDGSDGSSCNRYGGCCPFLSTEKNDEMEKCYCGTSYEDAKENKISCNYLEM